MVEGNYLSHGEVGAEFQRDNWTNDQRDAISRFLLKNHPDLTSGNRLAVMRCLQAEKKTAPYDCLQKDWPTLTGLWKNPKFRIIIAEPKLRMPVPYQPDFNEDPSVLTT